jgi:DnaJ-class molecular chaperone
MQTANSKTTRRIDCPECKGAGLFDGRKCYQCGGHGYLDQELCIFCNGQGIGICTDTDAIGNYIDVQCPCDGCEGLGWV